MKHYYRLSVVIIVVLPLFIACANVKPITSHVTGPERILEKNYKLNKPQDAYVGEELIKLKDFWIKQTIKNKMKCLNDFTINTIKWIGYNYSYSGVNGESYNLVGTTIINGKKLYLVKLPNTAVLFGITEKGEWSDISITGMKLIQKDSYELVPENTLFELVKESQVDTSQGFINYEILFNGTTKNSINLLYREYTPENMARPAFYQNLTYPIDTEIIRFKDIRIKVNTISNESISYTVLEDGLSE